jgi:hypothetical protein
MIRAGVRIGAVPKMMPVVRYFVFAGGALLALLFAVGASAPNPSVASSADPVAKTDAVTENLSLKIRSDRKWPERIVFDTSIPTITAALAASTETIAAPTAVAEYSPKARVRESFAQFVAPEPAKPESKPQHKRKIARNHAAPPTVLVAQPTMFAAQQPRLGLF